MRSFNITICHIMNNAMIVWWLGWSKKHQFFRINFFFWIGVRNVLKLACVKYFYLIPSRNVPTLQLKFPYFKPYLPNRRLLGSGNVRMLLNPKRLQQKVSMHFPTAQSLLNNISKICHWGIREKWSNYDVK